MSPTWREKSEPPPTSEVTPRYVRRRSSQPPPAETSCRTERVGDAVRVTLSGHLPLSWLGQLGASLARRSISIDGVNADRDGAGNWHAVLHVYGEYPHELERLDYAALCDGRAPDSADPRTLRISLFELSRAASGLLELHVEARDELGFLSALFARLAFLGLFADRVHAVTRGDRIDDLLRLHGVGGAAPSEAAEKALNQTLSRLRESSPTHEVARPLRRVLGTRAR